MYKQNSAIFCVAFLEPTIEKFAFYFVFMKCFKIMKKNADFSILGPKTLNHDQKYFFYYPKYMDNNEMWF